MAQPLSIDDGRVDHNRIGGVRHHVGHHGHVRARVAKRIEHDEHIADAHQSIVGQVGSAAIRHAPELTEQQQNVPNRHKTISIEVFWTFLLRVNRVIFNSQERLSIVDLVLVGGVHRIALQQHHIALEVAEFHEIRAVNRFSRDSRA